MLIRPDNIGIDLQRHEAVEAQVGLQMEPFVFTPTYGELSAQLSRVEGDQNTLWIEGKESSFLVVATGFRRYRDAFVPDGTIIHEDFTDNIAQLTARHEALRAQRLADTVRFSPDTYPAAEVALQELAMAFNSRFRLNVLYNGHHDAADAYDTAGGIQLGSLVYFEHSTYGDPTDQALNQPWLQIEQQVAARQNFGLRSELIDGINRQVNNDNQGEWSYQQTLFSELLLNGNLFQPADSFVTVGEGEAAITIKTFGSMATNGNSERTSTIIANARARSTVSQMLSRTMALEAAGHLNTTTEVYLLRGAKQREAIDAQLAAVNLPAKVSSTVPLEAYPPYSAVLAA